MDHTTESQIKQVEYSEKSVFQESLLLPSSLFGFHNTATMVEQTKSGRDLFVLYGELSAHPADSVCPKCGRKMHVHGSTFLLVLGFMLASTLGKMVVKRFSQMLQTEAGYDTCAKKRIEIGEHLRYLPMGYFNDTSRGHITSVTTNTLEQMSDIATTLIAITCAIASNVLWLFYLPI